VSRQLTGSWGSPDHRADEALVYGEFNNQLMPRLGVTFDDAWEIFEPLGYKAFAFSARLHLEHRPSPSSDFGNAVLVPREKVLGLLAAGVRIRR
jgi:hypothetical protein